MASATYTVGDLVAEFLNLCAAKTAFGVVSVHNIPLLDSIGRRNQIRFIMSRGEMGGAHMADAFARASGTLGILITSTGPGAANAVAGLLEARTASTPLLHITGAVPTKFADRDGGVAHDTRDQLGMLRSVSKSAYRIKSSQEALGILTRAAVEALTPPMGPVSIEIPIDVQRSSMERPAMLDSLVLPMSSPFAPAEGTMNELVDRVVQAKRPILWLGNGAKSAGSAAHQLLDMGFGMVSSWNGRGTVPEDHPMNLGGLHGGGMETLEKFYGNVDLLLAVGTRLRGHETLDYSTPLPKNIIQIDADPAAEGRSYPIAFFVCGDGKLTLEQLATRISGKMKVDAEFPAQFRALKVRARKEFRSSLGPYADFADQLRQAMPRDARLVRDITISHTTWANRIFPIYGPRDSIYAVGAGIGEGLAMAIGAAATSDGRKTVLLTGDGGFYFNLGELWTAVQERMDLTIIVMNDGGYGVIRHMQDGQAAGRRFYTDLMGPDLKGLADLSGIAYWRVNRADAFGEAVAAAVKGGGVSLVEVAMHEVGEFPPYYPFGPKIKSTV